MRKIGTIFLLAGLLSGCKTMPVNTCEKYTDDGLVAYTGKENPIQYLECIAPVEMAHFPYILQSLKESNAQLLRKYKNAENIRASLKKEAAYDTFELEHNPPGHYKPRITGIIQGHLSHLLHWMFGVPAKTERISVVVYNLYGWLEGVTCGKVRNELCLSDEVLAKLPRDNQTYHKIILSLTPKTEGIYALVIPIWDQGLQGWMISYYKF